MFLIGIVDDKTERIDEVVNAFEIAQSQDNAKGKEPEVVQGELWKLFPSAPLENPADYQSWILENDIKVLILDEKLREGSAGTMYDGHEVIDFLNKKMPRFPIVVITDHPGDDALSKRFPLVNDIIGREEWGKSGPALARRIINFGKIYNDVFEEKIKTIDELSVKTIEGTASEEDATKLKTLQNQLEIMSSDEKQKIEEWMDEIELTVRNLDKLEKKADEILEKVKNEQ